ncbi:hypothetical protein Tco_1170489 [Tanacetum coccineum]
MENLIMEEYMKKVRDEYIENEKIYAEAVVLINRKFVRLINITVEQWLDLKYSDHRTMDSYVKKGVIATCLIRSYKRQFDDYLAINRKRDVYERDHDIEYDPSNKVFAKWLASKICNHLDMDWHTRNALWVYWMWGNDEEVLIDDENFIQKEHDTNEGVELEEIFGINTNLFHYETPLYKAFNEFSHLLNIDVNLFTYDVPRLKAFDEEEWIDW